jgi:hypothetical protein
MRVATRPRLCESEELVFEFVEAGEEQFLEKRFRNHWIQ